MYKNIRSKIWFRTVYYGIVWIFYLFDLDSYMIYLASFKEGFYKNSFWNIETSIVTIFIVQRNQKNELYYFIHLVL